MLLPPLSKEAGRLLLLVVFFLLLRLGRLAEVFWAEIKGKAISLSLVGGTASRGSSERANQSSASIASLREQTVA